MMVQLCKVGAIVEVTKCDGSMLIEHYDDYIEDLYPFAIAMLEKRREDLKQQR